MEPNTPPPTNPNQTNSQLGSAGKNPKPFITPLRFVLSLVVLLVIITPIVLLTHKSTKTATQTAAAAGDPEENRAYDATVNIEPTSFSPSYDTVYAYTKVTFTNVGTVANLASVPAGSYYGTPRQIAVNPTSTGPDKGFTASPVIQAPQSWNYIFTKPGTYTYHDVNTPSINGTIVVVADPPGFTIQNDGASNNTPTGTNVN